MNTKINKSIKNAPKPPTEADIELGESLALWQQLCQGIRPLPAQSQRHSLLDSFADNSLESTPVATFKGKRNDNPIPLRASEDLKALAHKMMFARRLPSQRHLAKAVLEKPQSFVDADGPTAKRFRAGKLSVEQVLDLHGRTEIEAAGMFMRFFQQCRTRQYRHVLVVTGKGEGILLRGFARWLEHPDIRPYLIGVTAMPQHKGGGGAYGLLLRRK